MPPTQPEPSLAPSGQRRRSTLEAVLLYQPLLTTMVAVVVPMVGHDDPAVHSWQDTSFVAGLLS